jgi:hypothetical protein
MLQKYIFPSETMLCALPNRFLLPSEPGVNYTPHFLCIKIKMLNTEYCIYTFLCFSFRDAPHHDMENSDADQVRRQNGIYARPLYPCSHSLVPGVAPAHLIAWDLAPGARSEARGFQTALPTHNRSFTNTACPSTGKVINKWWRSVTLQTLVKTDHLPYHIPTIWHFRGS